MNPQVVRRDGVVAIVPSKNEELSIAQVIDELREIGIQRVVVGLDPASNDSTADIAISKNALLARSTASGYDGPCLAALALLRNEGFLGSVLFLDAGNKYVMSTVGQMLDAVEPTADITFGIRDTQQKWHQKVGNLLFRLAVLLRYRHNLLDPSSVRIAKMSVLNELNFEDRQFSLPFQTVLHALSRDKVLRYVPIRCTPARTGLSKVSGEWKNSMRAAQRMFASFFNVR
jgi:hypothetical protein